MPTTKITDLTAYTDPVNTDVLPIVDVTSDVTKKVSIANVMKNASLGSAAAPGIAFDGDTNTGIYSPGADQVAISTNGTGRLFVDASGNVGIGKVPSASKLDIKQSDDQQGIYLRAHNNDSQLRIHNSASGFWAISATYGTSGSYQPITFSTSDTERLRITSAGLVGIGTSSPSNILSIAEAGGPTVRLTDSTSGVFGLIQSGSNGDFTISADHGNAGASTNILFKSDGATERMRIDSSGRVGIGTTSVSQKLHLYDASNNTYMRAAVGAYTGVDFGAAADGTGVINVRDNAPLNFLTNATERARIDSSGRLLVGTSSNRGNWFNNSSWGGPLIQLESTSSTESAYSVTNSANNANAPLILLGKNRSGTIGGNTVVQSGDSCGQISFFGNDGTQMVEAARIDVAVDSTPGADDMPGRLVFSTTADGASSPTERMRIDSSGKVFVGMTTTTGDGVALEDTSSGGRLYVGRNNADSVAEFQYSGTRVGQITITSSSTSYVTSSDYRLKENVTAVTDGITRLQQLKPSRFNFIADPNTVVDGFIAHEVHTVVPEAISGEKDAVDDDGNPIYQGIDQSKLVPLLTAALQEAIGEIESLKARVAALESA